MTSRTAGTPAVCRRAAHLAPLAVRLAVLAALVAATSCAKRPEAVQARYQVSEYQPLAIGNSWTYVGKAMGQPVERTVTIVGQKDGYFLDDANGMLKADAEGLRDPKRYLIMAPIERGRTWTAIVSASSTERYEIADVGFTAATPAGSFGDCILVRATNRLDAEKQLRSEWTYAPGVGIVRFATVMKVGNRDLPQVSFELKSYTRK